jgi:hypothetical protein
MITKKNNYSVTAASLRLLKPAEVAKKGDVKYTTVL